MTADHLEKLFDALRQRSPWHPFTVERLGGHRFEVDHPQAMIVRDGVAVYLQPGGVPMWFDHDGVVQVIADVADTSA
jgi:hypothetical protein